MELNATIREYRPKDLEPVLGLVRELEAEMAEKFQARIKSGLEDYRKRYLNPSNKYKTWVAEADGKIVGYLIGYPSLGTSEIDTMYDVLPLPPGQLPAEFYMQITFVSKPYRKRGISTRLHEAVIAYARKMGFKAIYACIAKWNDPELRVIRSLNFHSKDLGYRYRLSLKLGDAESAPAEQKSK
ncbi:MAG: GNAT family N-acetyltransferase [Candidatus Aminicenantales bacterium]